MRQHLQYAYNYSWYSSEVLVRTILALGDGIVSILDDSGVILSKHYIPEDMIMAVLTKLLML